MEKSIEEFYEKFYNPTDIIKIEKNLVYKYGKKKNKYSSRPLLQNTL